MGARDHPSGPLTPSVPWASHVCGGTSRFLLRPGKTSTVRPWTSVAPNWALITRDTIAALEGLGSLYETQERYADAALLYQMGLDGLRHVERPNLAVFLPAGNVISLPCFIKTKPDWLSIFSSSRKRTFCNCWSDGCMRVVPFGSGLRTTIL